MKIRKRSTQMLTWIFFLIQRVKSKSLEDVVMLNVDTNTLETSFNDLSNLPSEVVNLVGFILFVI